MFRVLVRHDWSRLRRVRLVPSARGRPMTPWAPPWLVIALGELGEREIVGAKHNPRILEYGVAVRLRVTTDEIPWCSNFVNWCFMEAWTNARLSHALGHEVAMLIGTRSAAASSWATWGEETEIRLGAVAFWGKTDPDAGGTGHVAFVAGWTDAHILALGGNQANQVSAVLKPRAGAILRWPKGYVWP